MMYRRRGGKHRIGVLLCSVAVVGPVLLAGCGPEEEDRDFRQDMRDLVAAISSYAKAQDADFAVIPQNGHDLVSASGNPDGPADSVYLAAIAGMGREDLLYGYDGDDRATPADVTQEMMAYLDLAEAQGVEVLVTDYCSTPAHMDDSYQRNGVAGYISFAADHRELDNVPAYPAQPYNAHAGSVASLAQARNFLYVLNPGAFADKDAFLAALRQTSYDAIVMDMFVEDATGQPVALTGADVASLKTKAGGGTRMVVSYMSIGEAEDYRYYWVDGWRPGNPEWLAATNPLWPGNYKVRYWMEDWQSILFGTADAYLDRILAAGFDGVYLDIIDAFEYWE